MVETETSPYKNGPYMVFPDSSTYDGAEGCTVVFITDDGQGQLESSNDFQNVETGEMETIRIEDLFDAYNKVHNTDL